MKNLLYFVESLKFTPLEFETVNLSNPRNKENMLKFTPLEFETFAIDGDQLAFCLVKIYSVGV